MRALILLICFSLRIFLQEIRSLGEHLEVVSSNAVTVFFIKAAFSKSFSQITAEPENQDFHKYFLYIVK